MGRRGWGKVPNPEHAAVLSSRTCCTPNDTRYTERMPTETLARWERYLSLEQERRAIVDGLSQVEDPDARYLAIVAEQSELQEAIGEPRFGELCREWL